MQKGGDKLGYESEAFAIYDTMKYIKPEVHTLCVGNAFGESAMLLAAGTPVCRQPDPPDKFDNGDNRRAVDVLLGMYNL